MNQQTRNRDRYPLVRLGQGDFTRDVRLMPGPPGVHWAWLALVGVVSFLVGFLLRGVL